MVALLIRLKLTLLRAGFRRNGWQLVGFVLGLVVGLALAVGLALGLGATRTLDPAVAAALVTCVLAGTSFGLVLVPLVSTGVDDTLDPGRFALLPVGARDLLPGLLVGSLIGVTGPILLLGAAGGVVGLSTSAAALVAALVAAVLWAVVTVALRSGMAAAMSSPDTPRWVRDLATGVGVVLAACSGLLSNVVMVGVASATDLRERLEAIADVAGWTPFGLPWAIPRAVVAGDWVDAGLRLVLVLALVGLLLWGWARAVAERLVSPLESTGRAHEVRTGRLAALAPPTPAGGVMMRSLVNWRRDPRYVMNFAVALLMPVLFVAPILLQGVASTDLPLLPYAGAAVALSFAMVTMQDTSYDGSALWAHVVSGIRGVQDRWGRFLAVVTVAVPVVLLAAVVGAAVSGRWDQLPNGAGVGLGILLAGCGAGQLTSALWQFPAPQPGANQFSTPPGSTLATLLAMVVTWLVMGTLSVVLLVLWLLTRDAGALQHVVGPTGVLLGAGVAWGSIVAAGRWLDRRWPEVLAAVTERAA
ncbi:hypothetical protein [Kytococcus sp. Marseille-QA3725]